jgi:hypothetical protein
MNPALIIFAIRAIIRLGNATERAYAQSIGNKPLLFPDMRRPTLTKAALILRFFGKSDRLNQYLRSSNAPYSMFFVNDRIDLTTPGAIDTLFAASLQIAAEEKRLSAKNQESGGVSEESLEFSAGVVLVEQWSKEGEPLSPVVRVILTVADIALEYVGTNPAILGIGGTGEKLVGAIALNISELIPDDGDYGLKAQFGERLLGIIMQAGLRVIQENPDWITSQDHLKELVGNTMGPMLKAFDQKNLADQMVFQDVAKVLVGPAMSAALKTVANNPAAFLGKDFETEKAVGALTQELLETTAKLGVGDTLTKEGALSLYQAALGVIAERPGLFVGDGTRTRTVIARDLLKNMAKELNNSPPPFDGEVAAQLGAAALEAVATNTHRFVNQTDPWEKMAGVMAKDVIMSFSDGLTSNPNEPWRKVFSQAQLIDLGRIFLLQTTSTPGMIAGNNEELKIVVKAVATAMAADEKLLLTANDWREIAQVAAAEAAANPSRLFGLNYNNPQEQLAANLLKVLLDSGAKTLAAPNMAARAVLYDKALREATIVLLRAAVGRPDMARQNLGKVEVLATAISEIVAKNSELYGSKEWLGLFRLLLMGALVQGEVPILTVDVVDNLLEGGNG